MTKNKKRPSVEEQILAETTTEEPTVEEVIKPSVEEQILGASDKIKKVKVVDYASRERKYKVCNVQRNRTYTLNGLELGAILGMNTKAREELKRGEKSIKITKWVEEEEITLYTIEVIK